MKVEYRCNYCRKWVKRLEDLELHRIIHILGSDIVTDSSDCDTMVREIADTQTDTGDSK